jgi:membrane associated rhomboid family serine protease
MPLLSRYHPGNYSEEQYNLDKRIVRHSLFVSCSFVVVLWLVKFFEIEFNLDFSTWGIFPLAFKELRGIIFSPLIHANFDHLIANTFPLFILVFSLFFFYRNSAYTIFILVYLLSGLFVWLAGREAWHIGASGVIYGLAGFLFLSGIISFNIRLLTISLVVSLIYGGMFWGIFPIKPEVSWESHLWGGVSGFGLALLFRKSSVSDRSDQEEEDEDIDEDFGEEDDIDNEQLPTEENS